jgi:hypothetical protein
MKIAILLILIIQVFSFKGDQAQRAVFTVDPVPKPAVAPVVAPVQAKPAVAPVQAQPAVAPVQAQPAVAPVQAQPAVAPVQAQPAVAPVQAQPATTSNSTSPQTVTPVTIVSQPVVGLAQPSAYFGGSAVPYAFDSIYYDYNPVFYDYDPLVYSSYEFSDLYLPSEFDYDMRKKGTKEENVKKVKKMNVDELKNELTKLKTEIWGKENFSTKDIRSNKKAFDARWIMAQLKISRVLVLEDTMKNMKN